VSVRDNGIGIDPKALRHLFLPFTQLGSRAPRSRGGLGLGLALVRTLVQAHGGSVEALSDGPGSGSEFRVRVPLRDNRVLRRAPTEDAGPVRRAAAPRRVLVIEDNQDAADGLKTLMELMGHQVQVAHDGAAGLDLARRLTPDVLLCDLGLPGMSGLDVARTLRGEEATRSIHLVALTGYDQSSDQVRTRQAGFDRHLTKPVDAATLRRILDEAPAARGD
jgi:CheY-like chemotaxis protein